MLQPESMPHLVRRHIPHRLAHKAVRQFIRPHPGIHRASLHQTPVVEQRGDVMIPDHIRTEDLSAPRIDVGGSHRISDMGSGILDAREAQVIGIEVRHLLLSRIHPGTNGVAEARRPEGLLPVADTIEDRLTPLGGEGGVDVEGDRLHGIHHFAPRIGGTIGRLQPPPMDDLILLDPILIGRVVAPRGGEVADPAVGATRPHRAIRQQHHRPMDLQRSEVAVTRIGSNTLHLHIALKGPRPDNIRPATHRAPLGESKGIIALEEWIAIEEERRDINHSTMLCPRLHLEGPRDRRDEVSVKGSLDRILLIDIAVSRHHLKQHLILTSRLQAGDEGGDHHLTRHCRGRVGGTGDPAGKEQRPAEQTVRHLEVEVSLLLYRHDETGVDLRLAH